MSKPNLYCVRGGLGKQIAFTALIEGLYEKEKNKICMGSYYYPIFKHHPKVVKQYLFDNSLLADTTHYYYRKYNNIVYGDPYWSNFLKGEQHLIDSFAELYGVEKYIKEPDFYVDQELENKLKSDIIKLNNFIIVQFKGAENSNQKPTYKGYEYGQEVVDTLRKKYPFMTIINFRLEDQPSLIGCLEIPTASYQSFLIYAKYCSTFISIDSSLMHICANRHFNKKGVCLWGISSPKMFGYEKNINLKSNYTDANEIDPKLVIENIERILDGK